MSVYDWLLIDLDGTLVDPAQGILNSFRYSFEMMGIDVPQDAALVELIGPPLRQSFANLLAGKADPDLGLDHYRRRYAETGLYEATVYPGVRNALDRLRSSGARLIICTSKPHSFACRMLDHFSLTDLFAGIYGAELHGKFDDKADLIDHILSVEGLVPANCCMIGDRKHDVLAALRNEIATVGVLWGYGSAEELVTAGAASLCATPEGLESALRNARMAPLIFQA